MATIHTALLILLSVLIFSFVGAIVVVGMKTGWARRPMFTVGSGAGIAALIILAVMVGSYLYAPKSFSVSRSGVVVNRLVLPVLIPMAGIREVRRATAADLSGSIRTFGVGGLFGSYGSYYSKTLGSYKLYATNSDHAVIVIADKTYVLTPDQPLEFIAMILQCRASGGALT